MTERAHDPGAPVPPLPAWGGPFDGRDLAPRAGSADGHSWFVADAAGGSVLLEGDAPLREHWALALALGPHRPDAATAIGQVAGVYVVDEGLADEGHDGAGGRRAVWCALPPPGADARLRGGPTPAGRWRLRARLVWWETCCLLELDHLVGTVAEIVAVRDAWRGVREVERRTWDLAATLHLRRAP